MKKREKNGISTMMLLEPDFNPLDINCILQLNGYFVASRHLTKKRIKRRIQRAKTRRIRDDGEKKIQKH